MSLYLATSLGDEETTTWAIRCLCLLLISTKTKNNTGDIPYVMKFVPVSINLLKYNTL